MKPLAVAAAILAFSVDLSGRSATAAVTYLERLESPVYEAEGDHQVITKRALICVAQIVKPGMVTAPTITSSDLEGGLIVANSAFRYSFGLLSPTVRTTLTFEAKDGRFRIVQTNFERSFEDASGWTRVGLWPGSGGKQAATAAQALADRLADCVKAKPDAAW